MFNKKTLPALIAGPLALGISSVIQAQTQDVVLYTTSATDIRVVPLVQGIPDLNTGIDLTLSAPCEDDLSQPPSVIPLSNGDFLAIWWNSTNNNACYSRLAPDGNGSFTETHLGAWYGDASSNQWFPLPAADLNGDQNDDLVLFTRPSSGIKSYKYKVALGQADGSFDFSGTPTTFITGIWTALVTLADADGDSHADIVFHSFAGGGSHPTVLNMLKGQGDGTFAASPQHLFSTGQGQGSSVAVVANFDADSAPDVFLPPDDDVGDLGQAYIAFGQGAGQFGAVEESIDFEPSHESGTSDQFSASASACDINLDGHVDLIAHEAWWNQSRTTKVYWGDGNGHFSEPGVPLFATPYGDVDRLTCLSIPTVSDCDAVIYSTADKKITFDTLAMELYNPITDGPNGQFALFSGADMSLKALPGFYDFEYEGGSPTYTGQIIEGSDNCYPTYSAKKETVHFPKVEVPLVGVLPDGSIVDGPSACYEALFIQATTQATVFSLKEVSEMACE